MGIMWTSLNLVPRAFPFSWGAPPTRRKSPGNEDGVACGLCVNKMADAKLSSEDKQIKNPIETAVSKGASLVEPEKASISRKRKVNQIVTLTV